VHRHLADDETFFVLDGELRVEVGGEAHAAGAGAVAFLPRQLPHTLVVTSPQALYLTVHTPAGFDRFTLAVGTPATGTAPMPPDEVPPDRPPLRQWPVRTASKSSVRPRHRDSSSASAAPAGGRNPEAG
jgi:hypothetical protein